MHMGTPRAASVSSRRAAPGFQRHVAAVLLVHQLVHPLQKLVCGAGKAVRVDQIAGGLRQVHLRQPGGQVCGGFFAEPAHQHARHPVPQIHGIHQRAVQIKDRSPHASTMALVRSSRVLAAAQGSF